MIKHVLLCFGVGLLYMAVVVLIPLWFPFYFVYDTGHAWLTGADNV